MADPKLITLDGLSHAAGIIRQSIPDPVDLTPIQNALNNKADRADVITAGPPGLGGNLADGDYIVASFTTNSDGDKVLYRKKYIAPSIATPATDGLLSKEDKTKLDKISFTADGLISSDILPELSSSSSASIIIQ